MIRIIIRPPTQAVAHEQLSSNCPAGDAARDASNSPSTHMNGNGNHGGSGQLEIEINIDLSNPANVRMSNPTQNANLEQSDKMENAKNTAPSAHPAGLAPSKLPTVPPTDSSVSADDVAAMRPSIVGDALIVPDYERVPGLESVMNKMEDVKRAVAKLAKQAADIATETTTYAAELVEIDQELAELDQEWVEYEKEVAESGEKRAAFYKTTARYRTLAADSSGKVEYFRFHCGYLFDLEERVTLLRAEINDRFEDWRTSGGFL